VKITSGSGVSSGSMTINTEDSLGSTGSLIVESGAAFSGRSGDVSLTTGYGRITAGKISVSVGSSASGEGCLFIILLSN
jgi:hypothetical protein